MRKIVFSLMGLVLLSVISCKTKKLSVERGGGDLDVHRRIEEVIKYQNTPLSVASRVDVTFRSGQTDLSSKGDLRIIPGEGIYLSLQPFLGIELFRVVITPERVLVIDRTGRRYMVQDLSIVNQLVKTNNPYYYVESLFLNRMFVFGKSQVKASDFASFKIAKKPDNSLILTDELPRVANYSFTISDGNMLANSGATSVDEKFSMNWAYSNFISQSNYTLPSQIIITMKYDKTDVTLILKAPRIDFDREITIDKSLPSRYNEVELEQLLKTFIR